MTLRGARGPVINGWEEEHVFRFLIERSLWSRRGWRNPFPAVMDDDGAETQDAKWTSLSLTAACYPSTADAQLSPAFINPVRMSYLLRSFLLYYLLFY